MKMLPRVPAGRLGTKVNANFSDTWSGTAEYYHVFEQDRIASYETETEGYNMVNLGLAYNGQYMQGNDYRVYFKANNLLDETGLFAYLFLIDHSTSGA